MGRWEREKKDGTAKRPRDRENEKGRCMEVLEKRRKIWREDGENKLGKKRMEDEA
jgi:hypothetical protein